MLARAGWPKTSTATELSRVSGTPTFFLNGRRHHGAYDIENLSNAVRLARAKAAIVPYQDSHKP